MIASTLAVVGIAMTALPVLTVAGVIVTAIVFAVALDFVKIPLFGYLRIT